MQVHRFREKVAVHVGDGATTYLTPEQARALADALTRCADDTEARRFTESEFPTWNA